MKSIIFLLYLDIVLSSYYSLGLLRCSKQDVFTVHGLWADENNYPEFCTKEQFNISEISSLITEMNINWKSCYDNNTIFWNHEWSKHGTCTKMTQLNYFNSTLNLYYNATLNNYLEYCNKTKLECQLNYDKNFNFIK
jgi:ribonuclease I